jgi:hypothetical protein
MFGNESRRASLVVLLFACACGGGSTPPAAPAGGQSYADAIELICRVDSRAGLGDVEDPIDLAQKRHTWLDEHIKNPDAIYSYTLWRVKPPREQAAALREEAKTASVGACPLADSLASEPGD